MNKTWLQEKIEMRATERVNADFIRFAEIVKDNPILERLEISVGDKRFKFMNYYGQTGGVFFNSSRPTQIGIDNSNIEEIRTALFDKYVKEETDLLFEKLKNIEYLYRPNELRDDYGDGTPF